MACCSSNLFNFFNEDNKKKEKFFITIDTMVDTRIATIFLDNFLYYMKHKPLGKESVINAFNIACNEHSIKTLGTSTRTVNHKGYFGDPAVYLTNNIRHPPVYGIFRYTSQENTIIYTYGGKIEYSEGYEKIPENIKPKLIPSIVPPLPPYRQKSGRE